jgi:hypothetical protein
MGIASSSFSDRRVWSDDLSHPDLAAFAEVLTGERPHRRMIVRASRVFGLAICLLLLASAASSAQGSPAQWMARIFDPASLGITQFPGAVLNRKLSVDAIVLERGGDKRIGMFIIPLDQLKAAADHFATQFGIPAQVTGADSPFVAYTFDFTSGDKAPPKLAGLRVLITRSQFVDNKGQITMEYSPPKK